MKFKKIRKKILRVVVLMGMLLFCGFSFFMPVCQTRADWQNNDYEAFDKSLMAMISEHNDWDEGELLSISHENYVEQDGEILVNSSALNGFVVENDVVATTEVVSLKKLGDNVNYSIEGDNLVLERQSEINRLIVRSDDRISSCGASAVAEYKDYHIFQYENAEDAKDAYDYFSSLSSVFSVEYDAVVEVDSSIEADATTYQSWGWNTSEDWLGANAYINDMQASGLLGNLCDTVVAVLDSGINTSHELFQGRILHQYAKNFTEESSTTEYDYEDFNGHGTHVSGTIAEITFSNVMILPLKVLKENGKGLVSGIVNAINYAATVKAKGVNLKLLNMSIGVDASSTNKNVSSTSTSLTNAVKNAYYNSNILSIVSAGNDATDTSYANPANVDCAVTVSALKLNTFFGNKTIAFDTNYSNFGTHVDFAAPGTSICSAACSKHISNYGEEYTYMSGTSMAAPHVTACYALIYSNPNYESYSFEATNLMLQQNATDLGDAGRDDYYGYGAICLAKLGLVNNGDVIFSVDEQFQTQQIAVQLSYNYTLQDGETLKIYYSTSEDVNAIEPETSSTVELYSDLNPIVVSKTTKITAAAFVFDANDVLIQRSYNSSKIYYYDNIDLLSNYTFALYSEGVAIVEYSGELKTLRVPETVSYYNVVEIGNFAFNNSSVQVLYLPNTIKYIADSAFNGNSKIKQIYCESAGVEIGDYAFRWCSSLTSVNIENIVTAGEYAFANCSALESLYLPQITEIGKHCFSESVLAEIIIGKNVSDIGYQTKLSAPVVYGYSTTVARTFADDNSCQFVDLTLRISQDFPSRRVIKQSDGLEVRLKYFGLETSSKITFSGASNQIVYSENAISDFEKELVINLQNLAEMTTCQLKVEIKDYYSQVVESCSLNVVIVENSRNAYSIDFGEGNYEVFVDGELASESTLLYENIQYAISVNAADGFDLENLWLNGVEYSPNSTATISVEKNLQVAVKTNELVVLQIDFIVEQGGAVKIEGQSTSSVSVQRYDSLTFTVVEDVGYSVVAVKIDGVGLDLSQDGIYTIDNISKNQTVEVMFEETYYVVKVLLGKGGSLSPAELESSVAKGDSKTFFISTIEGYKFEYVSINGSVIDCDGHTFTIENIQEDCEVYISLQKQADVFGSEFSNIIRYFLVFLGLFFVFIVARVLLHYARKEKNKIDKNRYLKK